MTYRIGPHAKTPRKWPQKNAKIAKSRRPDDNSHKYTAEREALALCGGNRFSFVFSAFFRGYLISWDMEGLHVTSYRLRVWSKRKGKRINSRKDAKKTAAKERKDRKVKKAG